MDNRTINLAIVDDHVLFRKLLKSYFSRQENIKVAIQAPDAHELFSSLKFIPVDILLIDLFMLKLNGEEAVKIIREKYPEIKVIILSICTDPALLSRLMDIGIYGYISKADEPENLLQAVLAASQNRIFRNGYFTEALYWDKQAGANKKSTVIFEEREKKIIQLLWEEKSNKEIADAIFLSVRSVEKIRQNLKDKVGVKSTIGLLKYAFVHQIIRNDRSPEPYF
jgi:DNA-binding NarL/FixJ family response regulator